MGSKMWADEWGKKFPVCQIQKRRNWTYEWGFLVRMSNFLCAKIYMWVKANTLLESESRRSARRMLKNEEEGQRKEGLGKFKIARNRRQMNT
jgi:hypothetical protein